MKKPVSEAAMDQIFRDARSYNRWRDEDVPDQTLRDLIELMKWGATSGNCWPLRVVFVKSEEAKERLKPHLDDYNVVKVMSAPVIAILAFDTEFYERIPELFPHNPGAREWFVNDKDNNYENAFRNSTLQAAYLMLAARMLGLDCGPMSGFSQEGVNEEFFPDGQYRSNFLCCLGAGSTDQLFGRLPRPSFDSVAQII